MKTDIFSGKIKKEYFSYILGCMIFFMLLFAVGGALCIYAFVLEGSFNVSGERLLLAIFGVVAFVLGGGYVFPQLFLIRNFPKYPKLRRIFFNSDIYFTDSTSKEYYGRRIGWSAWRARKAFEIVTTCAESEKRMGKKSLDKYKLNLALSLFVSAFAIVFIVLTAIFKPAGTLFVFIFVCILLVCLALILHFFKQALFTAAMAPYEDVKWKFDLSFSLQDIAVRKNNKKHKFWYEVSQIDKIEEILDTCGENVELKLETKGKKKVSFSIVDMNDNILVFKGYFI